MIWLTKAFIIIGYPCPSKTSSFMLLILKLSGCKSQMRSGTTATRENFRAKLVERDGQECVWSGLGQGVGMHIIPFSEVVTTHHSKSATIWRTRTWDFEKRKWQEGSAALHSYFDSRIIAVLKICPRLLLWTNIFMSSHQTPNPILQVSDIPPWHDRLFPDGVN